ncbi:MAG: sigma factor-like helix-turn-helix DNA-binding protein [bacterium]|nr:sigma factor-like helix-turn-helix DNA-binding protein [bacterium]
MKYDFKTICQDIASQIPEKHRSVIERRFGLSNKTQETLQNIGASFNITRERVRQIERDVLKKRRIAGFDEPTEDFFKGLNSYLKQSGGAKREDLLLADFISNEAEKNCFLFLLALAPGVDRYSDNPETFAFWANEHQVKEKIIEVANNLVKKIEQGGLALKEKEMVQLASVKSRSFLQTCLEISKHLAKNPLGEFGLSTWAEIKPRGVRDAIYLILKHYKKPLHYKDIANFSNDFQGKGIFVSKKVLPQTAHNELIRDERFILVGRGTYALKEWGYQSGTVKEVIKNILIKSGSLTKSEVLSQVKAQRLVKDNTVYLNLSNKAEFVQDQSGKYTIKSV